jgi:hypothetical protein
MDTGGNAVGVFLPAQRFLCRLPFLAVDPRR